MADNTNSYDALNPPGASDDELSVEELDEAAGGGDQEEGVNTGVCNGNCPCPPV